MSREYTREVAQVSTVGFNLQPQLFDSFEYLFAWSKSDAQNASAAVTQDSSVAYEGNKSMLLDTGATTPAINDYVVATKSSALGPQRYLVFQGYFSINAADSRETVMFGFYANRQGIVHQPTIKINNQTGNIQIQNSDSSFTTINTIKSYYNSWNYIRITVDLTLKKYKHLIVNSQAFDISSYSYYTDTDTEYGFSELNITLTSLAAFRSRLNVDNVVIFTTDTI